MNLGMIFTPANTFWHERSGGRLLAMTQVYLRYISGISQVYIMYILGISQVYQRYISGIS